MATDMPWDHEKETRLNGETEESGKTLDNGMSQEAQTRANDVFAGASWSKGKNAEQQATTTRGKDLSGCC